MRTMKGDLSISDYLDKMNLVSDNLALTGQPVSDDELVQIIMNNLGPAFEMVVSVAQARDTPITYPTLAALFLTTKRKVADQVGAKSPPIMAIFVANRGCGASRPCGTGCGGAPSGRGTFFNPSGGATRGSFSNQHSIAPVGEAS
ncbi:hypothetical protein Acr_10g0010390 [Actinidia rufa]|uniref:Uncharacterized protein n=1 Tax=Actinidia rufa TaxID=165716 RepID=A0A7J0FAC2_9ERIC|nr:hypothetical protein Acr_10g0010390 [Actinidia rufa]